MAKILFISNIPTPYQLDFLDSLATFHEIRAIFLWSAGQNLDWQLGKRDWIEVLDHHQWTKTARRLAVLLYEMRPEAIIIGGYKLPFADFVKWWGALQGVKVAYWLEKPLPRGFIGSWVRRGVWCTKLPFAYGVACVGVEAVAAYAPFSRRTLNLPYSIDVSRYHVNRQAIGNGPARFLFVGQLIHRKGVSELLEAFASVPPSQAELMIAGSGELRPLVETYASRFPHIHFAGFVGPDALPTLYAAHDVLITPSRHDGWAVVVCEAMAVSMPVIGTGATGAFVEYIQNGRNGFQCEVSTDSIREGVLYYCQNRELIREHGDFNQRLVANSDANAPNAAKRLSSWLGLSAEGRRA